MTKTTRLFDGLHAIALGNVFIYLLDDPGGAILIDAGYPSDGPKILAALASMGRSPSDIRHIIVTHAHPDHIGALAMVQRETGATVHVHAIDRPVVEGAPPRKVTPTGDVFSWLVTTLLLRDPPPLEPARVGAELTDGQVLPFAGGLEIIHAPGHSNGQCALLWRRHGGVLFAADTCMNVLGLRMLPVCEDAGLARKSLSMLTQHDFDSVVFGHGAPILSDGGARFRKRWRQE